MSERYDLIVIGGGPGGYTAAIRAAQEGLKTALFEKQQVGGTCLNRGCIPTKALLRSAELFRELQSAEKLGLTVSGLDYDFEKMHERKLEVVFSLRMGVENLLKGNKIDLIREKASVEGAGLVRAGGELYECKNILLATGSVPALPPIDGIDGENIFHSDAFLEGNGIMAKRLVIIGGGVIGMEFASLYNALGCEVTVIEALDRILPAMDKEISQNLSVILKKRGVRIYVGARVEKLSGGAEVRCAFSTRDGELAADAVLVATGRKGNTSGLFNMDFELERGLIPVDENNETAIKGIYAIGDVRVGAVQLAHFAAADGLNAVAAICGKKPPADMSLVPGCIYTTPEIASVGLTADEAKAKGIAVKSGKFIMTANGKTVIEDGERGFIKLVCAEDGGRVLGAQLFCLRATDMVSELSTAISAGLSVEQLAAVIRPHPSFSEGVSEAAEDVLGFSVSTMPKRKL